MRNLYKVASKASRLKNRDKKVRNKETRKGKKKETINYGEFPDH